MSNYVKIECPKGYEELAATWQLKPLYVKSDQQDKFNTLICQLKHNPPFKLKDLVGCSLQENVSSPTLDCIDLVFQESSLLYRKLLKEATQQDSTSKIKTEKKSGGFFSFFVEPSFKKGDSVSRRRCLKKLHVREEVRIEGALQLLTLRVEVLASTIKESLGSGLLDLNFVKEMRLLDKCATYLVSTKIADVKPLKVDGKSIESYLTELNV